MAAMRAVNEAPEAEGVLRHGPPGTMLGRYRIGERIGSGGTAEVFRAEVEGAEGFAKTLVVKCLRPALADEPELVEGLAREAKLAQRLHHGNIVQVLDFGVQDGRPYVVMEHVDGCSLHELCADLRRRGERMELPEALFVVEEVAAALRYAHGLTDDQGVPLRLVHRDVKPRNVLVSREGVVKLADFGIAKLAGDHGDTLPGVIKGTPAWLAPEQALGRVVDARTDVFALGRLLRELAGGDDGAEAAPADPRVDEALREVWQRGARGSLLRRAIHAPRAAALAGRSRPRRGSGPALRVGPPRTAASSGRDPEAARCRAARRGRARRDDHQRGPGIDGDDERRSPPAPRMGGPRLRARDRWHGDGRVGERSVDRANRLRAARVVAARER